MGKNLKNRNLPRKSWTSQGKPAQNRTAKTSISGRTAVISVLIIAVLVTIGTIYALNRNVAKAALPNQNSPGNAVSTSSSSPKSGNSNGTASPAPAVNAGSEKDRKAVDVSIMTDKGEIVVELRPDLMPVTVDNFMKLVNQGFYNGLNFHRVEDWVVQGGDPRGDGTGGPGWSIKLETNPQLKNVKYAIAMARSQDPNSAGSQFYILKKDSAFLDGQYAVFGNVIKGQDVVDKIAIGDKMKEVKEIK